jgi:hypothetical protein
VSISFDGPILVNNGSLSSSSSEASYLLLLGVISKFDQLFNVRSVALCPLVFLLQLQAHLLWFKWYSFNMPFYSQKKKGKKEKFTAILSSLPYNQ